MRHRKSKLLAAHLSNRQTAVVFFPSRLVGELMEVLRADMMMLADNHPPKAG